MYDVVVILVVVCGAVLLHRWSARHTRGLYEACLENERAIGRAQEMYSTDNSGRFAPRLSLLVPKYLAEIPRCPARGLDTYTPGFSSGSNPDVYTIVCLGANHEDALDPDERGRDVHWLGDFGAANQPVVSAVQSRLPAHICW